MQKSVSKNACSNYLSCFLISQRFFDIVKFISIVYQSFPKKLLKFYVEKFSFLWVWHCNAQVEVHDNDYNSHLKLNSLLVIYLDLFYQFHQVSKRDWKSFLISCCCISLFQELQRIIQLTPSFHQIFNFIFEVTRFLMRNFFKCTLADRANSNDDVRFDSKKCFFARLKHWIFN